MTLRRHCECDTMYHKFSLLVLFALLWAPHAFQFDTGGTSSTVHSRLFGCRCSVSTRAQIRPASVLNAMDNDGSNSPSPSETAVKLKTQLLKRISEFRELKSRDGDVSIDFGVKGGELNETSRAPQKVDFYAISKDVGDKAVEIMGICDQLEAFSPISNATAFIGDEENGDQAPLNGPWKSLFTTAADANFSKNSTRGAAKAQNIVNGTKGIITNVIDFETKEDGTEPLLKQLNVVIKATAVSSKRIEIQFRIFRFGKKGTKKVPKGYFDLLYLDEELRIHRTGEDNIFVQSRETYEAAKPLLV